MPNRSSQEKKSPYSRQYSPLAKVVFHHNHLTALNINELEHLFELQACGSQLSTQQTEVIDELKASISILEATQIEEKIKQFCAGLTDDQLAKLNKIIANPEASSLRQSAQYQQTLFGTPIAPSSTMNDVTNHL